MNTHKNKNVVDTPIDSVLVTSPKFYPFDNGCLSFLLIKHYSDLVKRDPKSLSYDYHSVRTKGIQEPFIEVSFTLDTFMGPVVSKKEFDLREEDEFSIFKKLVRIMGKQMKLSSRKYREYTPRN